MSGAELTLNSPESTAPTRSFALPESVRRPTWLRGLVLPALILTLLEAAVRLGWVPAHLMPAPSQLLGTFQELAEGPLWQHIAASSKRVFAGFAIGTVLALALGAVVGLSKKAEDYIEPTFQALRAVPGLAWVPLLLIWLGIDEASKITLISIGAFFPVYMNLVAGIRDVDRKLVEVGTMYGFPHAKLIRRIFIPAATPYLFTGLRQALSMSWLCVVAAELLAATQGIGYLLTDGREVSRPDLVFVAIILLAALGKLTDTVLRTWETASLSWRDAYDGKKS
ncbi:ABC transporter permease [Noviherbaspirillum sedimenti]|uniref:ABC transporter permease n=1 Tax=Noviherbaspirillum sedimenti TaxID=2320865 RepID=A0A3A3G8K4_9BURK|nr:ABC transporter permease [Noviherbaspirillum sedimenti]RJG02892.1 ABC transporter permease [Noviherbaspirillum sedimenti]